MFSNHDQPAELRVEAPPPSPVRLAMAVMAALLVLAAVLRFGGIGREPLWADETLTARAANLSLGAIVTEATAWEHNPPLFSFVMHAWIRLAGISDAALRVPAALFGLLTVWFIYRVARQLGSERFARIALLLAAVWPILIQYSQEARTYSLFALMVTVSYDRLLRVLEDGAGRRETGLYALAVALCLYSHNQAILVIAGQGLTALGMAYFAGRRLPPARWWMGLAAGVAGFLPWVPTLLREARQVSSWPDWWLPAPAPVHLLWSFYSFATHTSEYPLDPAGAPLMPSGAFTGWLVVAVSGLVAALGVAAAFGSRRRRGHRRGAVLLLLLWWLAPQALAYIASSVSVPVYFPRFQLAVVPAMVLLAALGIDLLAENRPRLAWMAGAGLVIGQAIGLGSYYSTPVKEQWNEVARILNREGRPGDLVVLSAPFLRTPFWHYYRGDLVAMELADWADPRETASSLRQVLPHVRRVWFVEAFSGRHGGLRALEMLLPDGPSAKYAPRGIVLMRYDLGPGPRY